MVQAVSLATLARVHLDAQLARLLAHWTAGPSHYLAAFNRALRMACSELQAAAASASHIGGWPPAECYLSGETPWLPLGWWREDGVARLQQRLTRLSLPSIIDADTGAAGGDPLLRPLKELQLLRRLHV